VGTFSWMQGAQIPSFAMVVLNNSSQPSVTIKLCFMPGQLIIYQWYGVVLILSLYCVSPISLRELWSKLTLRWKKEELPYRGNKEISSSKLCKMLLRKVLSVMLLVIPWYLFLLWIEV